MPTYQNITIADVEAFGDVLSDLAEESESAPLSRLVELQASLDGLVRKAKDVQALLNAAALIAAREPVRVGNTIYYAEPDGKWRPDHPAIKAKVASRALVTDDGEIITDAQQAVAKAVNLCFHLFVSPSTMPKKGGLAEVGVGRYNQIAEWEHDGYKMVKSEVKADGEDG